MSLAARQPAHYEIVGGADPDPSRVRALADISGRSDFRGFASAAELLSEEKFADIMIIGTQDAQHREHATAAMRMGYDLLLEKPIASTLEDVREVERVARETGRRVLVCHVLRYAPFYRKVQEIVRSGLLGEVITINATEGVGPWHQAHSFVRGHWRKTAQASPMILAKSCHDLDIIRWLIGVPCTALSSFGSLTHFRKENMPDSAPARCLDGCPVEKTCLYHAKHYLGAHRDWLSYVCNLKDFSNEEGIRAWLAQSPWGRCVYQCDNDAVDHQVVAMEFQNGATATFTMTAFEHHRHIEIMGTQGRLRGGKFVEEQSGHEIQVYDFASGIESGIDPVYDRTGGYEGHGGGDAAMISVLHEEIRRPSPAEMTSSLDVSIASHCLAFAADEARRTGTVIANPEHLV